MLFFGSSSETGKDNGSIRVKEGILKEGTGLVTIALEES